MTVERFFIEEAKKANDIENFLREELDVAGFSHADVKRTPLGTRIIIHALRPGIVIGGGGSNIKRLTAYVDSKFDVENPHLEVEQIRDAFLDPHIVAWRIARSLEKGAYFKRVANLTMQRVNQAGAKGVEIRLSGKLPSARSKTWIFTSGKLRKCGQEAIDQVQRAYAKAMMRPGVVGVKVSILPPEATFSDAIIDREVATAVEVTTEKKPLVVPKEIKEPVKEIKEIIEKEVVEPTTEDKILSKIGDEDVAEVVETESVTESVEKEPTEVETVTEKPTEDVVETPVEGKTEKVTEAKVEAEVEKPTKVAAKDVAEESKETAVKTKPVKKTTEKAKKPVKKATKKVEKKK
ncbi:MAG: 30S ribosomal protein S3 [Candidatus Altiarchaeota archaeon]|nr:30S ribosomal protein S3 [Candidatus Altiarchaeota archaeon]